MYKLMITCVLAVLCAANGQEGLLENADGTEAITRPREDRTLSFVRSGLVAEVLVEDGDYVKKDQALVRLDDEAEKIQVEQLRLEAEDPIRIEAAKANLALKQVELAEVKEAKLQGAATVLELEAARVSVTIQELTLQNEHFQQAQDGRKYNEAKILLERMKIVSPIDGRVEALAVEAGEAIEAYAKIIRVVRIDPLWIDVPVPLARVRELLAEGQAAKVAFTSLAGKVSYGEGKIIKIGSVADAASSTLNVRVEIPNLAGRPAGEHVRVSFPHRDKPNVAGGKNEAAETPSKMKE